MSVQLRDLRVTVFVSRLWVIIEGSWSRLLWKSQVHNLSVALSQSSTQSLTYDKYRPREIFKEITSTHRLHGASEEAWKMFRVIPFTLFMQISCCVCEQLLWPWLLSRPVLIHRWMTRSENVTEANTPSQRWAVKVGTIQPLPWDVPRHFVTLGGRAGHEGQWTNSSGLTIAAITSMK